MKKLFSALMVGLFLVMGYLIMRALQKINSGAQSAKEAVVSAVESTVFEPLYSAVSADSSEGMRRWKEEKAAIEAQFGSDWEKFAMTKDGSLAVREFRLNWKKQKGYK